MTASQRTANPNGCAEPTKKEDDGIDTNIEALEEYILETEHPGDSRAYRIKDTKIVMVKEKKTNGNDNSK